MTPVLLRNGFETARDLRPEMVDPRSLRPIGEATREHPPKQIRKIRRSIEEFGFVYPVLIDSENRVIAGGALVLAAQEMRLAKIPACRLPDLSEAKARQLRLALNRLAEDSHWNSDALRRELTHLLEIDGGIEIEFTGFETSEIDALIIDDGSDHEDELEPVLDDRPPVSRVGDLWTAGDHRVVCGDARDPESYRALLAGERAEMVFTDPPYNVPIDGHVSGLGAIKHRDFVMAAGELSVTEFEGLLRDSLALSVRVSINGAIHFCCMDWRHLETLFAATKGIYSELKNLCVWNKSNAGMGSLYRSKHELVLVFKVGTAAHVNNVGLERHGRNRTNVWDFAGQTSLKGAKNKLALHPTVKPVALVAEAIRDCSHHGGIILDPFGGAGTTCIAAERTGRRARLIELDPIYVDVTIRRWQRLTGGSAISAETGRAFEDLAREREASHAE
jgi:DNA modification methylase